jgi:peptidylprolyl isomerase
MERRERDAQSELPRVRLRTTRGDITVELFLKEAPSTVSHFLKLVEQDFYDGLDFYQVLDHLLALTGDPLGDGSGNSGEYLADEHDRPDARHPLRGSLVMAKIPDGPNSYIPNSASSQFCILFLPIPRITEQQTVFGRVIEGMDVACSFRRVDPNEEKQEGMPSLPPDRILSADVIRRPESLPEPVYVEPPEILAAEQQRLPANLPPR